MAEKKTEKHVKKHPIVLPRNTGSLYVADKQWPSRGSVWEISATLTLEWRPGGEQRASIWMTGLREVPGKSRILTHTTECHSPTQIGSRCSQIFSWLLPGEKKGDTNTVSKNSGRGWVSRGGRGVRVGGGVEKKGRMLRTVAEEVGGISYRVHTVSLGQSWAQFFRYVLRGSLVVPLLSL